MKNQQNENAIKEINPNSDGIIQAIIKGAIGGAIIGIALGLLTGRLFPGLIIGTVAGAVGGFLAYKKADPGISSSSTNTHLNILSDQFGGPGGFITSEGLTDLNESGLIFSTVSLCPCDHDDNLLCPCPDGFWLHDPLDSPESPNDITFFLVEDDGNEIQKFPTREVINNLEKYTILISDFSYPFTNEKGEIKTKLHLRIKKNGNTLDIPNA